MASIVITIKTDGAAFGDNQNVTPHSDMRREVARILRVLANDFESKERCGPPRDIDSNVVGKVEVKD